MSLKFLTSFVLLAVASAIEVHQHAPLIKAYTAPALIKAPIVKHIEYEAPAEYEFSYSVHDPHTGDIKSQKESRKGDRVEGSYELIDPDGHRRIVQYTADHHTGFNAIVHREPTDIKIPIPEPKKIIHAAPIHKFIAAPIVHYSHAPAHIAHVAHVAPVAKILAPAHHGGGETHVSFSAPSVSYHY